MTESVSQLPVSARIVAVQDDLVTIERVALADGSKKPLMKNEVVYILPSRKTADGRQEWLKTEILRVNGERADAQVYESTGGVGVGDPVIQSGEMLSAELGPGLLGMVYDGLQNPLESLAVSYGTFLPRGVEMAALDEEKHWPFKALMKEGDQVHAGDRLGTVAESHFEHAVMAPFDLHGSWTVDWIMQGSFTVRDAVAQLSCNGETRQIQLRQRWPIRQPVSRALVQQQRASREYPQTPLTTTLRLVDTFFPIAKGGMGCIPGPFGAGKTVLQGLIARYSDVDIVIVVACGERAGEVVETIKEFPEMSDPKTGGTLMDRTIIICNTSSMPVAARETSIYMGMTLAEYYQAMGYDVLLIADSTSRWAQAMRETSGRLEEIPGEEAFPAYLDSSIKNVYERAGVIQRQDGSGKTGTLTMIGTVSPAGGNFEEPVTQSTLSTVKTFLGLSSERAYKRFYPAVDPLISWSRYFPQLADWFSKNLDSNWVTRVKALRELLERGEEINRMMQVTGEEGVTASDFIISQKAQLLDMVYLQQDAFDAVDVSVPMERQQALLKLVEQVIQHTPADHPAETDGGKSALRDFYTRLTGKLKNLNYAAWQSGDYLRLEQDVITMLAAPADADDTVATQTTEEDAG
ncbi:MAG: V-type ATP synthase subunit A [Oleibacter sp.]|nr:V-type ATP synthase subunit A [Thalassolituus sp.]|tara:strand:- start:156 stop:2057 length:1902 start_codon:yes stop_codon:yes gene_type:complete